MGKSYYLVKNELPVKTKNYEISRSFVKLLYTRYLNMALALNIFVRNYIILFIKFFI